jgi:hypothetical protein
LTNCNSPNMPGLSSRSVLRYAATPYVHESGTAPWPLSSVVLSNLLCTAPPLPESATQRAAHLDTAAMRHNCAQVKQKVAEVVLQEGPFHVQLLVAVARQT